MRDEPHDMIDIMARHDYGSHKGRQAIRLFFEFMKLPVPKEGEYLDLGRRAIIFLSQYGLALRVLSEQERKNIAATEGSDLALQPLKAVDLGEVSFAVVPGIEVLAYDEQQSTLPEDERVYLPFLKRVTKHTPFRLWDLDYNNIGVLPKKWNIEGQNMPFPTVLDFGSISQQSKECEIKPREDFKNAAAYCGIQEQLFAPVKNRLLEAWPEGEAPQPEKMQDFFKFCTDIVNKPEDDPDRILVPGWFMASGAGSKTKDAAKAAAKYQELLEPGSARPLMPW